MTAHNHGGESPAVATDTGVTNTLTPGAAPTRPASARRSSLRWVAVVPLVLLLAVALAARFHRKAPEPPLPANIQDPEVRAAIGRARQAVLDKPRSAFAWGYLGMTLEAHLYEDEADRCFREAARLDPDDARWSYLRGMYALKYDPDHAVAFLRQAAAGRCAAKYQSPMRLRFAEALLERNLLDEAETVYREEARRLPGGPRAAYGLGLIALARGNDGEAEKYLTTALSSPMARRPATAQLAALARARGADGVAARLEARAVPRSGDAAVWPDPLIDEIVDLRVGRTAPEQDPGALERQERFAEAADAYLRQVEEEPSTRAYVGAARNLGRIGDFDRAAALLSEALARDPDSAQAHFALAQNLTRRAENERQSAPDSAPAKAWLRNAVTHARRATELKPDYAQAYLVWGTALKYLGEPAAAVTPLRQGVTCFPGEFELQLALGEALLETDDLKGAAVHLENARELNLKDVRPAAALERLHRKQQEQRK